MVQCLHLFTARRGTSLHRWRVFIVGLLFLLSSQLTACGGEPTPVATATPALSPLEIATRAAEAMLSVHSLHFTIERDGALAYIDADQLLAFKRAEGDFGLPDRMRAIVRVITAFTPIDIGMVVLGDDQYATDPITGQWGRLPTEWGQFSLIVLFDPETGLQRLLKDGIIDLALVGSEEIEKQRHYHLTGRASGERVGAMTLGFIGRGDVELQVWIGAEDYYVRRLHIVEPETDPADPTTWDFSFSNLGQPVEIKAPPIPNS
jgi:lipoprotein LprG